MQLRRFFIPLALLLANTLFAAESYNDVVLIQNDLSTQSVEIATYFAVQRGIPDYHIYTQRHK